MRKRRSVQPRLEPVESRVVLSTVIVHAHLANAIAAHVSRLQAHQDRMRDLRTDRGHVTKLGHPVVRHHERTRAAATVADNAAKLRQPVDHFAPIPPPRKPPTAASQQSPSGLAGLFKSIASGI
jgi:hypothetical protein